MTTQPTPACPSCGALTNYESHTEVKGTLVPHRFHCHACGRVYIVRSTSHKQPKFALAARHEVQGEEAEAPGHDHEHGPEEAQPETSAAPTPETQP